MSQSNAALIRFEYRIELLEDLHSGSGLGSAWVDRTLARDQHGQPFIPASHVKGVWRDAMVRLVSLGVENFTDQRLASWFGAAPKHEGDSTTPKQSKLHCPRLVPETAIESLVWMQTARQRYSRKPAEDTLRSTEYIPAGTRLHGFGFFEGAEEHFKLLEVLVQRVDRYGGNRSRGDGRIKIVQFQRADLPDTERRLRFPDSHKAADGFRVLLKALEPVRVPRTGSPGNVIECDTRIPGRMLAGAIISSLLDRGGSAQVLFAQNVAIGDALPVKPGPTELDADQLRELEVLPAPLEYRVGKKCAQPCKAFETVPAWAKGEAQLQPVKEWKDLLTTQSQSAREDLDQVKRLPAGMYVRRIGRGPWQAHRQPLELAMRNRRGSDTTNQYGKMDNELFSNEQMPAGTCFSADIYPLAKNDNWQKWCEGFMHLCKESPLLFVGRGRAPLQIVTVSTLNDSNHSTPGKNDGFRLTLTSDAIIRTPWLGFHQRLTLQALRDALGDQFPKEATGLEAQDVSESRTDRAFNAATRLPRPSVMVLKAGSTIQITGKDAHELRAVLTDLHAIGERQHEGLGRFRLDLNLISRAGAASDKAEQAIDAEAGELRTEAVAIAARQFHAEYKSSLEKLSTSQWGSVRARIDALGRSAGAADLNCIRQSLGSTAAHSRAGKVFAELAKKDGFLDKLTGKMRNGWTVEDVRLCLRLVLAQLPRRAEPADAEQHGEQAENLEETEQ